MPPLFILEGRMREISMVIDRRTIEEYEKHYFSIHTRAKKPPIKNPYHESINVWMIMKRPMMNALKQRWKDFIVWFMESQGYSNLRIEKCDLEFTVYYPNDRRHDVDNTCPKFIIDGLCESGFLVDDDCKHLTQLTLRCGVDPEHPRTEIVASIYEAEEKEEHDHGKVGKEGIHQNNRRRNKSVVSKRDRRAVARGGRKRAPLPPPAGHAGVRQ